MAEFKISRIRYTWRNTWGNGTAYNRDDVIRYGGSTWICQRQHTASTFAADQAFLVGVDPRPAWLKMTDGYAWRGIWTASTLYNPGDLSLYGGIIYLCVTSHTSVGIFDDNAANWAVYLSAANWRTAWQPDTLYGPGDVVKYNGRVYRCRYEHVSESVLIGLEADDSSTGNWQIVHEGIEYVGTWINGTRYRENDLVKYGGSVLRCIVGHESQNVITNANFTTEFPGFNYASSWTSNDYFAIGDLVRHGGYLYYATANNFNENPDGSTQWAVISKGIRFQGTWSAAQDYKTGDVVRRGGNTYIAIADTVNDGSSLDYLDSSNWELLTSAQNVRGPWTQTTSYSINDVIVYLGSAYKCTVEHIASGENFPGDNGSGFNYWDLLLQAGSEVGLSSIGDLLTFDLVNSNKGDNSTFGVTAKSIGDANKLLTASSTGSLSYESTGSLNRTVFVSIHGIDTIENPLQGYSIDTPWRTIRYACEQINDGYSGTTTVDVTAGQFDEIGPIIVPANTVVLGAELRTTRINASPSVLPTQDAVYHIEILARIRSMIDDIISGNDLTPSKSGNNTENPVVLTLAVPVNAASVIENLFTNIISTINFNINSSGTPPTLVGTNTANLSTEIENVRTILTANTNFILAEARSYLALSYPLYNFNFTLLDVFLKEYLNSIKYDLRYTGNYKTLRAAEYYVNSVLGCTSNVNMFYMRNATGLRNCTLTGIDAELSPPLAFDLYQLPLGGTYVSLDPGWGPNDTTVWISTRSPYIQGVTTIGTGCVGQKIDGALHNGGNRSMVSNDFTQVLSDGIGAWVQNNGRAELVSVFSYYCHIGYLAKSGGKIRATNGNSSYGSYGVISDGVNVNEIPRTAVIDTRSGQATVAAAFAGDFVDEIQNIEFSHCGENYTTAQGSVQGAGVNASVKFEDFRDDAVFEARIIDKNTTGAQSIGGGGFVTTGNNAQGGNATTITLASNDQNTFTQYNGMRIIITSGAGTGQYGYIGAYDNITKIATIYKESDDTIGWDHVVSGKPATVPLLTNTVYRIEPRPVFSAPPYSATQIIAPSNVSWTNIIYGETTESFTDIATTTAGTGTVIEVTPAYASFDVVKNGRTYTITLNDGGAGYAVNQLLTIPGNLLGGDTPGNDIVMKVLDVSDDSTNSVLSAAEHIVNTGNESFGAGGKFVAVASGTSVAMYSDDGTTWVGFNMPSGGNWQCLAAGRVIYPTVGNHVFVAIRTGSDAAASSLNGVTWTARSMPASRAWNSAIYGDGVFLAIATNSNSAAYSLNGTSWTTVALPTFGDSTLNEWIDIAYGKNKFVVLANSGNTVAVGTYNSTTNTWSWAGQVMDVIADSSAKDWTSISYGNNRFVALSSTGEVAYSFDGVDWLPATMPTQDGSTAHYWKKIKYGQGVFFAIGDTGGRDIGGDASASPSTFAATSYDGVVWTSRQLASSKLWQNLAFGNPYIDSRDSTVGKKTPMWIAVDNTEYINKIQTGARALGRLTLSSGIIRTVKIWDPGSGYIESPTLTIIDPNNSSDPAVECRTGDGVLAQPSWINRGLGYRTTSTTVTITGDGYADVIPVGKFCVLNGLTQYPGPGSSLTIGNLVDFYTLVAVVPLDNTPLGFSAQIRVSPEFKSRDFVQHDTSVTIRTDISQCRVTGHDFLDIGTGNFEETNYPELYSGFYTPSPENEVVEANRGRVFYTSTDQSGNFRAGELFAVEQSTGVVTISADFFDLNGLSELRLGGIRVGGSGAVVREFSTDPLFTEDSNNVVPTQKAIKAYLAYRLSVGGSEIAVTSFIAGTILVGPNLINTTANQTNIFPVRTDFVGPTVGIRGTMLAQTMFHRSFR